MTSTEKKTYLEAYIALSESINQDIDEIARIKNRVRKRPESVSVSDINDELKSIDSRQSLVNKKVETLVKLRMNIEQSASLLKDRRLSLLIKYRYIDGLDWNEISEKLFISSKSGQIFVLHNKALNKIGI